MCGSRQLRVLRHGWRSSYCSPVQPGLWSYLVNCSRAACQQWLTGVTTVVLILAILRLRFALIRVLRRALLLFVGRRGTAQIAHARLDLVHQPDVLVVPHYA